MDFGGDACDGYTLNYRQVTVLNSNEFGRPNTRYADGNLRDRRWPVDALQVHLDQAGATGANGVDGDARLQPDGTWMCDFKQPRSAGFSGRRRSRSFPTEHLKRIIEAGRQGRRPWP